METPPGDATYESARKGGVEARNNTAMITFPWGRPTLFRPHTVTVDRLGQLLIKSG
jgi:hypothetical protein